jgi:hypothetical protein
MIVDAQDMYSKWYVGIVVDRKYDFDLGENSVKVHFYEFPERWDEWYNDNNYHNRITPYGNHTDEPKDKVYAMTLTHRRAIHNEITMKKEM